MKKTRGLSMAVTAALLILVSIALVAALWLYSNRFTSGGAVVQASANLVSDRWIGSGSNAVPVYTVDISLQSKAQTRLILKQINIIYTTKSGMSQTAQLTYTNNKWTFGNGGNGGTGGGTAQASSAGKVVAAKMLSILGHNKPKLYMATVLSNAPGILQAAVSPNGMVTIQPNGLVHVTLSITGNPNNPPVQMSFQLVFQDDAGNTYTVQTNSIQTG